MSSEQRNGGEDRVWTQNMDHDGEWKGQQQCQHLKIQLPHPTAVVFTPLERLAAAKETHLQPPAQCSSASSSIMSSWTGFPHHLPHLPAKIVIPQEQAIQTQQGYPPLGSPRRQLSCPHHDPRGTSSTGYRKQKPALFYLLPEKKKEKALIIHMLNC